MIPQKKNKSWSFSNSIRDLIHPLSGKPALISAITTIILFACVEAFPYGLFLTIPLLIANHYFSRFIQWCIFISLAVGCLVLMGKGDGAGLPIAKNIPARGIGTDKEEICGNVEAVLPRPKGTAFIIDDGALRYRVTEKRQLPNLPEPGDRICFTARWNQSFPVTVPGGFDSEKWLRSQNLAAQGKFISWTSHQGKWIPERSFYHFRQWIKKRLEKYLDPAETGLLLGLLAGDKSGIPEALKNDFQRSGLVHVLAISGFHVVLLAGMLMIFLKATGLPHGIVRIIAITLLFLYIPVTGSSPAVRRAVMMFAIPQIGLFFQRPANTMNSLGVALLFILLPHPEELWNPGFQLSVAATVGIILGSSMNPLEKIPSELRKNKLWNFIENFIISPTYVTLWATLSTAPFLIHHFRTLSPLAWLGNIAVVPAISLGMQAGLFALMSPLQFLQKNFCSAASFFLRLASLITRFLSESSQAAMTIGPFGPAILLLLGGMFLLIPLWRKNPIARIYGLCSLLIFAGIFCYSSYEKILAPSWKLTAIDVGQGDSFLITTPSGRHILIDAGDNSRIDSGKNIIVPYLRHIGVMKLDALVITHPDADHYGGAESIIKMFPVKELWISECARIEPKEEWELVQGKAQERGIIIRDVGRGFLWDENLFQIRALHPDVKASLAGDAGAGCRETNTGSITLRASGLGHAALLTGDLTVQGERSILQTDIHLKSEVLKLGHHGSKTSSSTEFLEAVSPELAIISSGRRNKFHHPHPQVTRRLDSLDIPYLNTAEKGTISITFSEGTTSIETMLP